MKLSELQAPDGAQGPAAAPAAKTKLSDLASTGLVQAPAPAASPLKLSAVAAAPPAPAMKLSEVGKAPEPAPETPKGFPYDDPNKEYGSILPIARNKETGERELAVPEIIRSPLRGALAPRDVLTGRRTDLEAAAGDTGNLLGLSAGGKPGIEKGVSAAAAPMKEVGKTLEKAFSPTTVSPIAGRAEGIIREKIGEGNRSSAQAEATLEKYRPEVGKHLKPFDDYLAQTKATGTPPAGPKPALLDMIDHIEGGGQPVSEPALQPLADSLKKIYAERKAAVQATPSTAQASFIDDYFPHLWKDPAKAQAEFSGAAPKQGSGRNLKERTIPTLSEGIARGLEPVTSDPVEMTLRYVTNMDRYVATNRIFDTARSEKAIKWFSPGNQPAGWTELKGRLAEKAVPIRNADGVPGARGIKAYAPEDFARVYNNFISRGFHEFPTGGKIYDKLQKTFNTMTGSELGLSAFHVRTMAQEAMVSGLAKAIGQATRGEVVKGIKSGARAATPWEAGAQIRTGKKVQDQYLGLANHGPDFAKITDLGTKANMRVTGRERQYRDSAMGSYWNSFKRGSLGAEMRAAGQDIRNRPVAGTAVQFGKAYARLMDTVAQPVFDGMIPKLKAGAFHDMMKDWLDAHPSATPDEQQASARQIWDSVDNRFGELVNDNIFWNKMLKQTMQLAFRAVSWDVGTLREIVGGAKDLAMTRSIQGLKDLSPRAKYVIALPIIAGLSNAVSQFLHTGKAPESLDDLQAYQTGGTNKDGTPERAMSPGYMKDVYGYLHDPVGEVGGKVGTPLRTLWELMTNKDWKGQPIAETSEAAQANGALPWWAAYAQHVAEGYVPMSVKQLAQGTKTGSALGPINTIAGEKAAPGYMQNPERDKMLSERRERQAEKAKHRTESRMKQDRQP